MAKKTKKIIHIGKRPIGGEHPAFIIAEAGINHNGQLELAKKLVDIAVESGADAVKFQMRNFDSLYTNDAFNQTKSEDIGTQYFLSLIRDNELQTNHFREIVDYCNHKNIIFLCTPWDLKSVDILDSFGVPAYKIASADMVNFELLEHVASKGKPMIVSTGMSTLEEIQDTVKFLNKIGAEFILLHCNSSYPSAPKDLNLRFINRLEEMFGCIVGYSGHELGYATTLATIPIGAKVVERHFTIDRTMTGPDHALSLEPQGLIRLVRDIRRIEEALSGDKKYITAGEFINRKVLGKSLVSTRDIKKGEVIKRDMITAKSPAKGISPQKLFHLVGKRAIRDIAKEDYFTDSDLGKSKVKKDFKSKNRWSMIVRPHDAEDMIKESNPPVVEFHFSSHDLNHPISFSKTYPNIEMVVHVPELWGDKLFDLCSDDRAVTDHSINNLKFFLDKVRGMRKFFSKTPKKMKVVVHPGGMSYTGFVDEDARKRMYETLADSLSQIDQSDIEIVLENLPPFPWYKGGQWFSNIFMDADEIDAFCKKYKYKICYDTSHAQLYCNFANKDQLEFAKKIKAHVKHAHISDAIGTDGEGIQVDEGSVPFKKLMPEILKLNITMSPEIWMGHRNGGEGVWTALNRLKKYGL